MSCLAVASMSLLNKPLFSPITTEVVFNMNTFDHLNAATSTLAGSRTKVLKTGAKAEKQNSYMSMLQAPMTVLACNVSDRADITAVAILGYN
jgi:hypothetical protein